MTDGHAPRVGAVVLAAGAGTRFGGAKLSAPLDGRPIVRHVIDAAVAARLEPIVVVAPPDDGLAGVDLAPARVVVNPHPGDGLSSSVRIGLRGLDAAAAQPKVDAAVILPGDQPRVRPAVIRALVGAASHSPDTPFVVARHARDRSPNPVLARREVWRLADELVGDRGIGPLLPSRPELVHWVDVEGDNPDVDTQADLDRLAGTDPPSGDVS
jgi:molybdenum cofactor cytidylyltransferase